jgi:carboxyl-terminal processing protease
MEQAKLTRSDTEQDRLKEADLTHHLDNSAAAETTQEAGKPKKTSKADDDFQLNEALNLLKGINIYGKKHS